MSPTARRVPALLATFDPSTAPFVRAYSLGYAAAVVPSLLRIILGGLLKRKGAAPSSGLLGVLREVLVAMVKGLSPRGLAMAFGVSVGGAKWGESRVEPFVRRMYERVLRSRKGVNAKVDGGKEDDVATHAYHERMIASLSTWAAATIASLVSITLLQSSPRYRRPALGGSGSLAGDELEYGPSPYPSLVAPNPGPASNVTRASSSTTKFQKSVVPQSPTLDITLFILVRAADTLVRGIYEYTGVTNGRGGAVVAFVASQADTLVFWLSCWRIMWCWFYLPSRLPPSYNKWISTLARMDPRLLQLLRDARSGAYTYGQEPSAEVAKMTAGIASALGISSSIVNPHHITRLDCSVVHGKVGTQSCEVNALKRFLQAFVDSLAIYLPVHLVPQLLFNSSGIMKSPVASFVKIALAASRSSAFLAAFVGSVYAGVCLFRTRIPLLLLPSVRPQVWDAGLCAGAGAFLCGFSVLIENKRRRREMALYCAPRALYALMDELVPTFLSVGARGELISRWIERFIFALSTGTVISATVHRPDLVSGVVRGIMGKAIGDWGAVQRR